MSQSISGQHWYLPDGRPFYEVAARDGHMRPVTLRDARKFGAVPSVTTVGSIMARPQLVEWKIKQGIMAALTLPQYAGEPEAEWLSRVAADAKEEARKAAERGSEIHAALEAHYTGQRGNPKYVATVTAVSAALARECPGEAGWVAEKAFAHPAGFGGRVDLHSMHYRAVVDYKSKDGDVTQVKQLGYDQNIQLAAYGWGLGIDRPVGINVFVSRDVPGSVAVKVWTPEEMARGLEVFKAQLALWQAVKCYAPQASAGLTCSAATRGTDDANF